MRRGDVGGVINEAGSWTPGLNAGWQTSVGEIGGVVRARLTIVGRLCGVTVTWLLAMKDDAEEDIVESRRL